MRCQGYTLFELTLALSIISLLTLIGFPAFRYGFWQIKTLLVIHQISHEIYLARSEAIAKQRIAVYCSENEGCWEKMRMIKQGSKIQHRFQKLPMHYQLTLRNSLHQNDSVTFTPLGFTASEYGSFYLKTPYECVKIIFTGSGKIRISREIS